MRRGPKFALFRLWVEPLSFSKTNGDKLRLLSPGDGDAGQDRKAHLKLAWFFATVAVLLVLAFQLGRVQRQTDANFAPDSTALVSLKVLSPVRSGNGPGFSMRFRLSNRGNHSVFYPISTTTSGPVGQLVARTSPASDWTSLSSTSNERVAAVRNFTDQNLTWIEMPPGGWVDGEFPDTANSPVEHAYAMYVKPTRDANGIRIVSNSYNSLPN